MPTKSESETVMVSAEGKDTELARRLAALQKTGEPMIMTHKRATRKGSGDKHSRFIFDVVSLKNDRRREEELSESSRFGNGVVRSNNRKLLLFQSMKIEFMIWTRFAKME